MEQVFITLLVGAIGGFILLRFRVPGALIIGSILFVAIFNIFFDSAYILSEGRLVAQVIAGAFIGSGISKSDLFHMRSLGKPAFIIIGGLLILSIFTGITMYLISPMDLITSLMAAVPGGMSYMPLISDELGADSSKVAIMQFTRMIFGIGVLPYIIKYFGKNNQKPKATNKLQEIDTIIKETHTVYDGILTFAIALLFGYLGSITGFPSGTLAFALFGTIIYKIKFNKAYVPRRLKQFAQILAGSYIGSGINMSDVLELKYLFLPALVLLTGYFLACVYLGKILEKVHTFTLEEGMFAATPAGAADMALLLEDFGISNKDIVVIQIVRMIVVISLFPQIMVMVMKLLHSFNF